MTIRHGSARTAASHKRNEASRPDEERVVLVDVSDRPLGSAGKLLVHQENLRHRAISVLIFDRAGDMLLQRRSMSKYHSPGLWTNTCCSHPRPGERPSSAAARRLTEEMGFATPLRFVSRFRYQAPVGNGLWENEIVYVFSGRYEGTVLPDKNEVAEFSWQAVDSIQTDIAAHPDRYTAWFKLYVQATWFKENVVASIERIHARPLLQELCVHR